MTISILPLIHLLPAQKIIFLGMLEEAGANAFLSGQQFDTTEASLIQVVMDSNQPIGFFTPRKQDWKGKPHWRAGALFLMKEQRGQGHMKEALAGFYGTKKRGLAWISDENVASQNLFSSLGFTVDKQRLDADGTPGHWWVKS